MTLWPMSVGDYRAQASARLRQSRRHGRKTETEPATVCGSHRIVSACGKVKNKSQVHAFTSFLSLEPTEGHSSSDWPMTTAYGWLADPARETEFRSCEDSTDFDPACTSVEEAFAKIT